MKFRFTGEGEITLRHMTFRSGVTTEVEDADLAAKISVLPYFEEVKPGRPKNADKG